MAKQKRRITSSKAPQKTVFSTYIQSAESESTSETPQSSATDDGKDESSSPGSANEDENDESTGEQSNTTSSSDGFGRIPIRSRIRFSLEEKEVLERAFKKSKRPTNEVKQRLAQDMDTNVSRIQIWFQNRRAKEKKTSKSSSNHQVGQGSGSNGSLSPESVDSNTTAAAIKDRKPHKITESSPRENSSIGRKRKKQEQSATAGALPHQFLPSESYATPYPNFPHTFQPFDSSSAANTQIPGGNLFYSLPARRVYISDYDWHVCHQPFPQQLQKSFANDKSVKYVDPKKVVNPESFKTDNSSSSSQSDAFQSRKGKIKEKAIANEVNAEQDEDINDDRDL